MTPTRSISLVLAIGLTLAACHKTPPEVASDPVPSEATEAPQGVPAHVIDTLVERFAKVHFDFDSSTLTDASKAALTANATLLQKHPGLRIEVQGHADERGTTDYNLALGNRRAQAVTSFLATSGVNANRLKVVSYGEERPDVTGTDEVAWSANRRCEFRILTRDGDVQGTVADL